MRQDTALVVVDMQNLFVDIGGEKVVDAVNEQVARADEHGWPVYYTRDYAPNDLPTDDPALDLHPKLDVRGTVVPKGPGKNGGFSGFLLAPELGNDEGPGAGGLSPLAGLLRAAGVRTVLVVGIAADVCVAATARDALRLGYEVTVVLGATAFVGAHPHGNEAAVAELRAAGVTVV
jgi:nicotinamidase/pyrazinamidase